LSIVKSNTAIENNMVAIINIFVSPKTVFTLPTTHAFQMRSHISELGSPSVPDFGSHIGFVAMVYMLKRSGSCAAYGGSQRRVPEGKNICEGKREDGRSLSDMR
jgi:hypothetical protein